MCNRISLFFEAGAGNARAPQNGPGNSLGKIREHRSGKKRCIGDGNEKKRIPLKLITTGAPWVFRIRSFSATEVLPIALQGCKPYILVDFNLD
jgi:hypothetical protein